MNSQLLTSQQAAQLLTMDELTLEKMTASKKLPAVQLEGEWQYEKADLQRWLRLQSCQNWGERQG